MFFDAYYNLYLQETLVATPLELTLTMCYLTLSYCSVYYWTKIDPFDKIIDSADFALAPFTFVLHLTEYALEGFPKKKIPHPWYVKARGYWKFDELDKACKFAENLKEEATVGIVIQTGNYTYADFVIKDSIDYRCFVLYKNNVPCKVIYPNIAGSSPNVGKIKGKGKYKLLDHSGGKSETLTTWEI